MSSGFGYDAAIIPIHGATMSKPESKPTLAADALIQEEALRMARSVQKPGQTKEQTKLVAQGIAKGIELYKKQQSAKSRERDRQRKRMLKQRQADAAELAGSSEDFSEDFVESPDWPAGTAAALWAGSGLFAAMALAHLVRALLGWPVTVGPWEVPLWASMAAAPVLAALAAWLLLQARQLR